jgi:hypothetical protein
MTLILNEKNNKDLIFFKDNSERNLLYISARNGHTSICELLINLGIYDINDIQYTGSTALHAAAYYGQKNVVKILLDYGAKTNIKNNFGNLPKDEAMAQEIKNLLEEAEKDRIGILYQSLYSKNIASKLIPLSSHGKIIARKIVCKLNNLPKCYNSTEVTKNWITAWHGTKFTSLESIAEVGLKPAGGKSKDGKKIDICVGHIDRDKTINNIPNWGEAIFVSPSIFYSAHPAYAKEIFCENESWKTFVEVKVKPNSFTEHELTVRKSKYKFKEGETDKLEYRIEPKNEKDVQVVSLTFVKSQALDSMSKFSESNFLKFTTQDDFENEPKYLNHQIQFKKPFDYQEDLIGHNYKHYQQYDPSRKYNPDKLYHCKRTQYKEIKMINLELEKLIYLLMKNKCCEYEEFLYQVKNIVKNIEKIYYDLVQKDLDIDIEYKYIKSLNEIIVKAKLDIKTIKLLQNLIYLIEGKMRYL